MRDLVPSEATALICGWRCRRGSKPSGCGASPTPSTGLPAHVTLAYPFAEPAAIDDALVALVAEVVARHAPWTMRLVERRRWPDAVYAAIEPEAPAVALQADLAAAFPSLPIYGGTIDVFVPHVTIAEGQAVDDPAVDADPGWDDLPVTWPSARSS